MFSSLFTTGGESLPIELVSAVTKETTSYGHEFSITAAYHVQSDFKPGAKSPITVEIVSVNYKPFETPLKTSINLITSP